MDQEIRRRLEQAGVSPDEVEERFSRSSGPGGQHVNKTSTAVTLHHPGLGISVSVQDTRSQARNRELAWERLAETLERKHREDSARRRQEREKHRRRNRKRPRGVRERMLESKRRRGEKKQLRRRVD